jgi:hypothetical protein
MMLVGPPPRFAHEPDRVRIVHHHQRAVLIGEIADRSQVRNVTIHREHAVRRDHFEPAVRRLLQLRREVGHVVVQITEPLRFAEADAVDDAGVVQLVRNDRVLGAQQRLEQPAVRVKA